MELSQLVWILRANLWRILRVTAITMAIAVVALLLFPRSYKATTSLVLNYKGVDFVTDRAAPNQSSSGYLPTYISTQMGVMKSMTVSLCVVDALKLADDPVWQEKFNNATSGKGEVRDWIADALLRKLYVESSRESGVVDIAFKNDSAQFSADVANQFAQCYQLVSARMESQPSKNMVEYFTSQLNQAREVFEKAQAAVSSYQEKNDVVNNEGPTASVEQERLHELERQLVAVDAAYADVASRSREARGDKMEEAADVAASPVIQSLKLDLSRAEAKLSSLSERYTSEHPAYIQAMSEVEKLRSELQAQMRMVSRSLSNSVRVLDQRRQALVDAIASQRKKIMSVNYKKDELSLRLRDLETARQVYESISQRLAQTKVQAQSNRSDVQVLHPASPPLKPAGPGNVLIVLFAGVAGLLLGMGAVLLRELTDRRVRSRNDIEHVLDLPVIGTMGTFVSALPPLAPRLPYRNLVAISRA